MGQESIGVGRTERTDLPARADRIEWSLPRRIAFRFVFLYFGLFSFPFPIGVLPWTDRISGAYDSLWNRFVPWAGNHIFGIAREIHVNTTGSGDTTFNYVQLACLALLALLGTILWSLFARRTEYRTLDHWLRVYVRYVLATAMLGYGMAKVFKSQFPIPSAFRLLEPYGDSSPMALLWTFMGFSTPYTVFAGLAESIGGVLLFSRRTLALGALVVLAVMANVVMLNFSYDVPVKLYSVHLWLMAAFVLLPDARRLADVFILNRPTEALVLAPTGRAPAARMRVAAKLAFIGFLVYSSIREGYTTWKTYGDGAPRDPLDGAYEVEQFTANHVELLPVMTNSHRWRKVGISTYGRLVVRMMDDSMLRFQLERDSVSRLLTIWPDTGDVRYPLSYYWVDPAHLVLRGTLRADSIQVHMRKIPLSDFPLMNRGFHWINEFPYNR